MRLTKDGITIEIFPAADIANYKRIGYVEVKDDPNPEPQPVTPVIEIVEDTQQAKDQATVEEIVEPLKGKKAGKK